MRRRLVLGIAAGGVLALAGGLVVLDAGRDPGTFSLTSEEFLTASPSARPTPSSPPAPEPTRRPAPTASALPPTTPATPARPRATATATARPATATPTYRPGPRRALPTCDAPLPNACAHRGATQAVTAGVTDLSCAPTGATGIRIRWDSDHLDGRGGAPPVDEFVVRVWRHPAGSTDTASERIRGYDRLYQVRVARNTFDVTVRNLMQGERYACWVQELNVAGLSRAAGVRHLRIPGPSPAPSGTPTEPPAETGSPSPEPGPQATPA